MKMTYTTPSTRCFVTAEATTILAGAASASAAFDSEKSIQGNDDIGVKASAANSYDVWSEDWRK